jgi:predicted anti-sigma-YlaC factor YlaD
MNASCDSLERLSLGAYVLGALDPVERAGIEAHLAACEVCRDELAGLAAMPGLLSRVRLEDVLEPDPSPSPAATGRLLARVRAARRTRRRRLGATVGAFAAAAAAVIAIVLATSGGDAAAPGTSGPAISATSPGTGVSASFGMRPAAWGTAVRVHLRGVPANTRCKLVVYGQAGRHEVAGTWRATYEGTADVQAATAIPRSRLTAFEVTTASGRRLVRATL